MRVVVVGGGTAGHVIPALPVMQFLQDAGHEVHFIGTHSGLEERLVAERSVPFHAISAGKLRRYFSWQNATDVLRIGRGLWQSWRLLGRLRPQVVFSKGGFVSFPVAVAAWLRRIPLVAHESDLSPGLANRLVLPFAQTLCVSFAATFAEGPPPRSRARVVHTGTPIRASMLSGDAQRGRAFVAGRGLPLVVVTGGSLGADRLNEGLRAALDALCARYDVFHVCGPGKMLATQGQAGYFQHEFVDSEWGDVLAAADVVVSRAGANALFELLALRKPNVLIPLTAQASRGDQLENAAYAERAGFSVVLQEAALSVDSLVSSIDQVYDNREALAAQLAQFDIPPAAERIALQVLEAASPTKSS